MLSRALRVLLAIAGSSLRAMWPAFVDPLIDTVERMRGTVTLAAKVGAAGLKVAALAPELSHP
jgi:hypothetical protein